MVSIDHVDVDYNSTNVARLGVENENVSAPKPPTVVFPDSE